MARACALFFVQRTEVEALAKSSRGVIRSFRLEFSTLRRRGEGETANRVKMRIRRRDPTINFQGTSVFCTQATTGDRRDSMTKARSARRSVEHRLPQLRDNGRCSPVLYGRVAARNRPR